MALINPGTADFLVLRAATGFQRLREMKELYTLEKEVGRGSYGVVFEGHIAKTGQKVAIKRLPCSKPECIELYLQEIWAMRATAKNHVNVIALHSCLLQTGPRTLKPLKAGKLPRQLVESVLKGSVAKASPYQRNHSRSCVRRRSTSVSGLQDRTNTMQTGPKLQDKVDPSWPDVSTPKRPQNRGRKRSMQQHEDPPAPLYCLALWLVMEYCDGGDLNQFLLSRLPDNQNNHAVVRQLCSAVAFLHSLGITHRDLKPDNVLVCVTSKGPVVKVGRSGMITQLDRCVCVQERQREHY